MDRFDDGAREERRERAAAEREDRAERDFDRGKAGDLPGAAAREAHRRALEVLERDAERDRRRHRGD